MPYQVVRRMPRLYIRNDRKERCCTTWWLLTRKHRRQSSRRCTNPRSLPSQPSGSPVRRRRRNEGS